VNLWISLDYVAGWLGIPDTELILADQTLRATNEPKRGDIRRLTNKRGFDNASPNSFIHVRILLNTQYRMKPSSYRTAFQILRRVKSFGHECQCSRLARRSYAKINSVSGIPSHPAT